jgi:hypothetical protein
MVRDVGVCFHNANGLVGQKNGQEFQAPCGIRCWINALQYAVRQVEVFENGNVLRFDRSTGAMRSGSSWGLGFSRQPKWAVFFPGGGTIEAAEF